MRRICVVVEGQTEAQFMSTVLAPLAHAQDIYLQPIVVLTKETKTARFKGGGGSWDLYRNNVKNLRGQRWERIGVMFDLYACPPGTPGYDPKLRGAQLHASVAEATQRDLESITQGQALAGPVLHELETLVIAAIATGATEAEHEVVTKAKSAIRSTGGNVELVNGGAMTAPSKRLKEWWPGYEKVLYGTMLLSEAPWEDIARQCPTFSAWWDRLLA